MQTLSTALSQLSPLPAKSKKKRQYGHGKPVAASDPFACVQNASGLRLSLPGANFLVVERACLMAFFCAFALYGTAAVLANEWLYLLSGALFTAAVLAIILPLLIVSSVEAQAWLPEYGAASEASELVVRIRQRRSLGPLRHLLPLSCLRVRIVLARRTVGGYVADDCLSREPIVLESCGQEATISLQAAAIGRGVYKLSHADIASCMPFGFAWSIKPVSFTRDETAGNALVVMPRVAELRGNFLEALEGIFSPMGMRFNNVRSFSQSTSSRGLREFRTGDSIRHIHWASSARLSRLLVREFDSESQPVFNLFLNLRANWQSREQFELAVYLAYSLVHFGYDHDMLPELFISPPLDSPDIEELMFDLPQLKSPLDMLGETLARVEQLPTRNDGSDSKPLDSRYQLLAIVPSKHSTLVTGGAAFPVKVMIVDPGSPVSHGKTIATIYSEQDLQAL